MVTSLECSLRSRREEKRSQRYERPNYATPEPAPVRQNNSINALSPNMEFSIRGMRG